MSLLSTALLTSTLVGTVCAGTTNGLPCNTQMINCNTNTCITASCDTLSKLDLNSLLSKSNVKVIYGKNCIVGTDGSKNCAGTQTGSGTQTGTGTQTGGGTQTGTGTQTGGGTQTGTGTQIDTGYAAKVAELVNVERAKYNLQPLTFDSAISAAAQVRAKEITTSFSHTRPNGSSASTVLGENGISYRGYGENIAWGQSTPEEVVNAWMNSSGHRANILNKKFTNIGVGYYVKNNTAYWTQLFTY